jgi:alpha-1,3-rhamnosyl/mannosyltransferase
MHSKSRKKPRIIVNAIPIVNVSTGIGRYILSLYRHIERNYAQDFEINYFDGATLHRTLPLGAKNKGSKSKTNLLWKLPPVLGFLARSVLHSRRERLFMDYAKDFDLYHETAFFPFRTRQHIPVAFTIHDISLFRFPKWHPKERVMFYNHYFFKRLADVAQYIAVSHFTKSEVVSRLNIAPERIQVTQLAYDEELFLMPTQEEAAAARAKFGLPERFFLFVGSGDPRKNLKLIPAAIERSGLDIPLVNVGWSGWLSDAPTDRRVINVGYVDDADLPKLYASALAMIYPSVYEGFGLPLLEAMACGCPVVTTRCASLPEVGGDAALYVERPDLDAGPSELAALLAQLVQEPQLAASMREKGLIRSREFSWDKTAAETVAAFTKVLQPAS